MLGVEENPWGVEPVWAKTQENFRIFYIIYHHNKMSKFRTPLEILGAKKENTGSHLKFQIFGTKFGPKNFFAEKNFFGEKKFFWVKNKFFVRKGTNFLAQ